MYRVYTTIATILLLAGCADYYGPEDYGYHYTDVTPMGIRYRVDPDGVELEPATIDYHFAMTMNCVGQTFDPENLLVISTAGDANPYANETIVEGYSWQPTPGNPAMAVVNAVADLSGLYPVMSHEFIHVTARSDSHNPPAFARCDRRWSQWLSGLM